MALYCKNFEELKWEKNEILHDIWGREMIKWYGFPVGSIFEKKKTFFQCEWNNE